MRGAVVGGGGQIKKETHQQRGQRHTYTRYMDMVSFVLVMSKGG
jgi:hypothetical protein